MQAWQKSIPAAVYFWEFVKFLGYVSSDAMRGVSTFLVYLADRVLASEECLVTWPDKPRRGFLLIARHATPGTQRHHFYNPGWG